MLRRPKTKTTSPSGTLNVGGHLAGPVGGQVGGDVGTKDETFTWMVRLAERLARRDRLRELNAPESIVEAELDLVERAKSALSAEQILFVLRRRDELIRYFDPSKGTEQAAPDKATDPS